MHSQELPEILEMPEQGLRFNLQEKIDLFEKKLLSDAVLRCSSTPELARHLKISQPTIIVHRIIFLWLKKFMISMMFKTW
jgi:hypothetical protein